MAMWKLEIKELETIWTTTAPAPREDLRNIMRMEIEWQHAIPTQQWFTDRVRWCKDLNRFGEFKPDQQIEIAGLEEHKLFDEHTISDLLKVKAPDYEQFLKNWESQKCSALDEPLAKECLSKLEMILQPKHFDGVGFSLL